ncbi:MAG TPA: hypothetical protein VGQ98_04905 [Gemmatimonadaceae bacterium]|nr:hypothetical protein [Gemmatimonadaceae bacterium]
MRAELLVLRLIHILSGIAWLGSGLFTSFFLIPALSSSPAVMGEVLAGLQRRRQFLVLQIVAALTILSGLRLLWIDSAGYAASYFASGTGRTFAISAGAAIIAAVLSFGVARPAVVRAGAIAASLAASADAGERERLAEQLDRLRRRGTIASVLAVGFGLLAASGMAIARYV